MSQVQATPPVAEAAPASTSTLNRACACGAGAGISGKCPACDTDDRLGIQPKLTLSTAGDPYEQEADRIADQVVSGSAIAAPPGITRLARNRTEGDMPRPHRDRLQRQTRTTEDDEEEIQAKRSSDTGQPSSRLQQAAAAVASGGRPLGPIDRRYFESRLGRDLSGVRLHTGTSAGRAARAINARAYTLRNHIAFAPGAFDTGSAEGRRLLAHELVHTLQQGGPGTPVRRFAPPEAGNRKPAFRVSQGVIDETAGLLRQIYAGVDRKTFKTLVSSKTVVVGVVLDDEGTPRRVYTVSQNWTNESLRQVAEEQLKLTRLNPAVPVEGRGKVGAPGDAEQLMIEDAQSTGHRVRMMAVSRPVCPDCKLAIKHYEDGSIRVVEVSIPKSRFQLRRQLNREQRQARRALKAAKKRERKAQRGAATTGKSGRGGAGKAAAKASRAASKGGATLKGAPARGAPKAPAISLRGLALQAAIAMIADQIFKVWLDQDNAERLQKDLEQKSAMVELEVADKQQMVQEITDAGDTPFATVTFSIIYQNTEAGPVYFTSSLQDVAIEKTPLERVKRTRIEKTSFLNELTGQEELKYEEILSFSLSIPDLALQSDLEEDFSVDFEVTLCFIATACYGSSLAPEVVVLRAWRDSTLQRSRPGRAFIRSYYAISPPIAVFLGRHPGLASVVRRCVLDPLVRLLSRSAVDGPDTPGCQGHQAAEQSR